jgi:hypothetical protein
MARAVNQVRWDQWRQLIARQRVSGLSVAEFCRQENVSRQGFHVWNRKLRQRASVPHGPAGAVPQHRSPKRRLSSAPRRRTRRALPEPAAPTGHGTKPGTVRSMVAPGFLQLPVTAVRSCPWIELALPDGTVVRLPQQNLAALAAVLRALRGEGFEHSEDAGRHA